ncbi:MBL fold metallo-hydrolase [Actinomadura nitritigenes]|uniref:MBL fold metallo-hydrolase n=1 Tax=Actinomadura nitritigenes TaxID=134602 RepID=UPI003D9285FD
MQITHFGHACVLLDFGDRNRILIDPGSYSTGFETVRDLAAVLVTHEHPDHLDLDRLPQLLRDNPRARLIVDPGSAQRLAQAGIDHHTATPGQTLDHGTPTEVLGGDHAVIHPDLPAVANNGYLFQDLVLHPGDAFDAPSGDVRLLLLPTAGPWMKLSDGIDFMRALEPELVIPIHQAGLAPVHRQLHYRLFQALAPKRTQIEILEHGTSFTC